MAEETLHVKNMVCRRCVMTVEDICRELGIAGCKVELGSIIFAGQLGGQIRDKLYERLRDVGFEPLRSHELVMLEKIKAAIRYYARHYQSCGMIKLSAYLAEESGLGFRRASRLFASHEGRTVQSYLMSQRVEYVKELLGDDELSLAAIADRAGFSSVAHLSRAFKKSQGMTISRFRDGGHGRVGIDEV